MDELERLKEEYGKALKSGSNRSMAVLESKIRDEVRRRDPDDYTPLRALIRGMFPKVESSSVDSRRALLIHDDSCEQLWDALDDKTIKPKKAERVLRSAVKVAKEKKTSVKKAISSMLKNSDSRQRSEPVESAPKPKRATQSPQAPVPMTTNQFLKRMKELSKEYIENVGQAIPEHRREPLANEMYELIKLSLEDIVREVNRHKRYEKEEKNARRVGKVSLRAACDVLGLNLQWGKKFDLNLARKRKNERMKELHPDLNGGNHQYQDELNNVLDAYSIIEQYHQQVSNA